MKLIPYNYLYGKRNVFPYHYRLLYLHILETAPFDPDNYDRGFKDGYEVGLAEARAERVLNYGENNADTQ